ncbi:MAG: hypothetical protein JRG91_16160, partial [Deltaproteobacteria bacterium]|nr:hypothetical protein [Deltaproteobacteria bacterium]
MGDDLPEGVTRELLRERISMARPDVVLYREIPKFDGRTVRIMVEKIQELTAGLEQFDLVLDLTEAT